MFSFRALLYSDNQEMWGEGGRKSKKKEGEDRIFQRQRAPWGRSLEHTVLIVALDKLFTRPILQFPLR
jgi:hypothetical protein